MLWRNALSFPQKSFHTDREADLWILKGYARRPCANVGLLAMTGAGHCCLTTMARIPRL